MRVETTRMSSRGQVVIPQDIRDEMNADEGTVFAVFGSKDSVLLKKIETPSKEALVKDLERIAKQGRKRLESRDLKESDIPGIVQASRRK